MNPFVSRFAVDMLRIEHLLIAFTATLVCVASLGQMPPEAVETHQSQRDDLQELQELNRKITHLTFSARLALARTYMQTFEGGTTIIKTISLSKCNDTNMTVFRDHFIEDGNRLQRLIQESMITDPTREQVSVFGEYLDVLDDATHYWIQVLGLLNHHYVTFNNVCEHARGAFNESQATRFITDANEAMDRLALAWSTHAHDPSTHSTHGAHATGYGSPSG